MAHSKRINYIINLMRKNIYLKSTPYLFFSEISVDPFGHHSFVAKALLGNISAFHSRNPLIFGALENRPRTHVYALQFEPAFPKWGLFRLSVKSYAKGLGPVSRSLSNSHLDRRICIA